MPKNTESIIRGGYTPFSLTRDYHLDTFGNTLDKITQQHEKAVQQQAQIRLALDQLNLNEAEDEYKQNYINNIMSQIDRAAQFGNYSSALTTATRLAGKALTDPGLTARVRANEEYEKERARQQERLAKGEISQNTYNWWLGRNPYRFVESTDANGNVVGGKLNMSTAAPVNDINWANQANLAFRLITPSKNSRSRDGSTTVNNATGEPITRNGNTYKVGEGISSSSHSTNSQESISIEDIRANMEELLSATPDGYRQVEQAFNVAYDEFVNMQKEYERLLAEDPTNQNTINLGQQLDARKKLMYKNGSLIDYNEYYARMITDNLYAQGLAYDWRTTASGGTSGYSISTPAAGGGRGPGSGGAYGPYQGGYQFGNGTWDGPLVRQPSDAFGSEHQVGASAGRISGRF